jgi:methionine aminopeptidase
MTPNTTDQDIDEMEAAEFTAALATTILQDMENGCDPQVSLDELRALCFGYLALYNELTDMELESVTTH